MIGLYLLANLAYFFTLPIDAIQNAPADRVATAMLQAIFPGLGVALMALAIMISTFGCMNGMLLTGARAYYAMAKDGVFFKSTGELNLERRARAGARGAGDLDVFAGAAANLRSGHACIWQSL